MIFGHVRDNLPRVTPSIMLSTRGRNAAYSVEFIVDTGFEGELALPGSVLEQLDIASSDFRYMRLADGSVQRLESYDITIIWNDEPRVVDVIRLDGNPLLGVELLAGNLIQIEMNDGGEVSIEEL